MQEVINRRVGAAVLCILVCSTLVWLLLGTPSSGINEADAYLSQALHVLTGHGAVEGSGDHPGSLLWLIICAMGFVVSPSPELPLLMTNLLFGMATVYLCLQRCTQKPAFLLLLCAAPFWFAWSQASMVETGVYGLMLTASVLSVSERNVQHCTWLLPLLALARPEAMLWGCWLIILLYAGLGLDRGWRVALRAVFRPLFSFGITCTFAILIRWLYFSFDAGRPFDFAQSRPFDFAQGRGIVYFLAWLASNPAVLLSAAICIWVIVREIIRSVTTRSPSTHSGSKQTLSPVLTVGLALLPGILFPLMSGDAVFMGFRHFQPVWPLLCLVAAWAMPLIYDRQHKWVRRAAPVLLLSVGWIVFAASPSMKLEFQLAHQSREQGTVLARMFEGHANMPSVGTMTAGGCKVAYSGAVYNLAGLPMEDAAPVDPVSTTGPTIAARRLQQWQPDILVRCVSDDPDRCVLRHMESDLWFQQRYTKGELWYNDEILFGFFSREFLEGLEEGHYAFSQDVQYALRMKESTDLYVPYPVEDKSEEMAAILESMLEVDVAN